MKRDDEYDDNIPRILVPAGIEEALDELINSGEVSTRQLMDAAKKFATHALEHYSGERLKCALDVSIALASFYHEAES